jgi:hypothetical protein
VHLEQKDGSGCFVGKPAVTIFAISAPLFVSPKRGRAPVGNFGRPSDSSWIFKKKYLPNRLLVHPFI